MSILSTIIEKIMPHALAAAPAPSPSPTAASPAAIRPPPVLPQADLEEILSAKESGAGQKLDWRHSIVDLMKMLDMDSSLTARKELAKELNYTGDAADSAKMNIWLHQQVMQKLEANGGKIPDSMKH